MTDLLISILIVDVREKNKTNNYNNKPKIIWNNPQNALNDLQNIQRKIKPYPSSATLEW